MAHLRENGFDCNEKSFKGTDCTFVQIENNNNKNNSSWNNPIQPAHTRTRKREAQQ